MARRGGGIGVARFELTNVDFLLRGKGATLSWFKEIVLWRVSSLTDAIALLQISQVIRVQWEEREKNRVEIEKKNIRKKEENE